MSKQGSVKQMKEIHDLKKTKEITKEDLNNCEYFIDVIADIILDFAGDPDSGNEFLFTFKL